MATHWGLTLQKTQVKPRKEWEEWERGEGGKEGGRGGIKEKGCHILVVCSDSCFCGGLWSGRALAEKWEGSGRSWGRRKYMIKIYCRKEEKDTWQVRKFSGSTEAGLLWEMTFVKQDFQHLSMVFRSQSPSVGCNNSHWLRTSLNWQPRTAAWVISGRLQSSPW